MKLQQFNISDPAKGDGILYHHLKLVYKLSKKSGQHQPVVYIDPEKNTIYHVGNPINIFIIASEIRSLTWFIANWPKGVYSLKQIINWMGHYPSIVVPKQIESVPFVAPESNLFDRREIVAILPDTRVVFSDVQALVKNKMKFYLHFRSGYGGFRRVDDEYNPLKKKDFQIPSWTKNEWTIKLPKSWPEIHCGLIMAKPHAAIEYTCGRGVAVWKFKRMQIHLWV